MGNHLSEDEVERMSGKTPQHTNIAPNMASNASTRVDPERKAIKDSKDKQTARGRHFDIRFSMVAWQAKDQDGACLMQSMDSSKIQLKLYLAAALFLREAQL